MIDWQKVKLAMLDMDGTLLDLAYDNFFWRTFVPERYAAANSMGFDEAVEILAPHFENSRGQLQWYCTDHWSEITGLNIAELKVLTRDRVQILPGVIAFLDWLDERNIPVWLVTNAHRDSLKVKMEKTGIAGRFQKLISSHDYGAPKENQNFWQAMRAQFDFVPEHTLFADDSIPVIGSAAKYGIGYTALITHPDRSIDPLVLADAAAMPPVSVMVAGLSELIDSAHAKTA